MASMDPCNYWQFYGEGHGTLGFVESWNNMAWVSGWLETKVNSELYGLGLWPWLRIALFIACSLSPLSLSVSTEFNGCWILEVHVLDESRTSCWDGLAVSILSLQQDSRPQSAGSRRWRASATSSNARASSLHSKESQVAIWGILNQTTNNCNPMQFLLTTTTCYYVGIWHWVSKSF